MKGLQLAEEYYNAYGKIMLREKFPFLTERAAIGLVGAGSECLGFDDVISTDHDFGPAFCIWLTADDYNEYGSALALEYSKLPSEFNGVKGRINESHGGGRVGVHSIPAFYYGLIGREMAPEKNSEWMWIPESRLCMAVNGKVFTDPLGEFTGIRDKLLAFYPEDVRIKKIVARAAVIAQSGQYNYARAMKRGEYVAAQLALSEFIKNAISMVYLLNKTYTPFYKWMHRGMLALPRLTKVAELINLLVNTDNQNQAWKDTKPSDYLYTLNGQDKKVNLIEEICSLILQELITQDLASGRDTFLESHTMEMMDKIKDPYISSLQIMEG